MDDLAGPLRIIKQRLLKCAPFLGLAKDKVRDIREQIPDPRHRVKDCPERPLLLDNLAYVLVSWKSAHASAPYVDFLSADDQSLIEMLEHYASVRSELPKLGIRFGGKNTRHRAILQKMQDLCEELRQSRLVYRAQAGQWLPAAPLHDARSLTIQTVQLMAEDFRAFGPRKPPKGEFPLDARYHALAVILQAFGIPNTHGKPFTAAGIQQLLWRHRPTRDMYPRDDCLDN